MLTGTCHCGATHWILEGDPGPITAKAVARVLVDLNAFLGTAERTMVQRFLGSPRIEAN